MPTPAWKNRNIFADVLHHEDALTDTLRNFLKYQIVQEALWRTLGDQVPEFVNFSKITDIQTRPSGGSSREHPDLVLYGPDFILVIEVKIGAELTDAQQEAYISWTQKKIESSQMGFIVFLIPDDYSHRPQLDSCIEKAREHLCCSKNSMIKVLDSITWQEFIREFRLQNIPVQYELIQEFYNHLSGRFKSVEFSSKEIHLMRSKETASGILKLRCLIDKVKAKLESKGFHKSKLNEYDYGYDFSSAGSKELVYFGIWHEFWDCRGYPLCIAISTDSQVPAPRPSHAFQKQDRKYGTVEPEFEDDGGGKWLVVGFGLPGPGEDCGKLIEEIGKDIESLLRKGEN